ncbi:unnamed protein product [Prunus armeniaca]|uniref:Peptidase C1A papain C-terminal domain-containing protein n=1 Tax=Prunus armeniaca TaxID=36596 RepID=A0A6J5U407_PRUAR|nr:unnamed protein product [Prunus armeniaca]
MAMAMAILRKFQKIGTRSTFGSKPQGSSNLSRATDIDLRPWITAVDLRPWMGPIRDQHDKPYCWAFAVTACVETLRTLRTGRKTTLSPESVIHRLGRVRKRTTAYRSPKALALIWMKGIHLEVDWPYHATKPNNQKTLHLCTLQLNELSLQMRRNLFMKELYFAEKVYITGVKIIKGEDAIKNELDQGRPVVCSVACHINLIRYKGGILGPQECYGAICPLKAKCSKKKCKVETPSDCTKKKCPYKICDRDRVWTWCNRCGYGHGFHAMCILGYNNAACRNACVPEEEEEEEEKDEEIEKEKEVRYSMQTQAFLKG